MEETPKVYEPNIEDKNQFKDSIQDHIGNTSSVQFSESFNDEGFRLGKDIANNMMSNEYHPVIIFGSSYSGKSSLLGSLLAYFQVDTSKEVGITLGDSLIPESSPHGKEAMSNARAFFYRSINEFIGGEAHQATRLQFPLFIPVVIRPKDKPALKFALMESNGEWYKPARDTDDFFQALKSEILGILTHYSEGISFIHIAPYTQSLIRGGSISLDQERKEMADASLAIVGALTSYEKYRNDQSKGKDSHMFLVTKWDASADKNIIEVLENPGISSVEKFAAENYTQAFAAFKGLGLDRSKRSIMQYCSGLISGRDIIKPSKELTPILWKYPQTMWNWLYKNASPDGYILLPMPPPIKDPLWKNIMNWIQKHL